jgi:hypothetical protein
LGVFDQGAELGGETLDLLPRQRLVHVFLQGGDLRVTGGSKEDVPVLDLEVGVACDEVGLIVETDFGEAGALGEVERSRSSKFSIASVSSSWMCSKTALTFRASTWTSVTS